MIAIGVRVGRTVVRRQWLGDRRSGDGRQVVRLRWADPNCALSTTQFARRFPGKQLRELHLRSCDETTSTPTRCYTLHSSRPIEYRHHVQGYEGHGYAAHPRHDDAPEPAALRAPDTADAQSGSGTSCAGGASRMHADKVTRRKSTAVSPLTWRPSRAGLPIDAYSSYRFPASPPAQEHPH